MVTTTQILVFLMVASTLRANGDPQVPCYFIFGDSLLDNGNNNRLLTEAKVNFPPYGIDFPDGPTGRFSNGRNTADVIAQLLGFDKFIPPFATAKGGEIVTGVNYASGAAGIRAETGQHLVRFLTYRF
ncbi:putative triacylglycerol lipase [Helianthus annuus]|nr:putative triacylglycerol lipase [Helianthus annuus]